MRSLQNKPSVKPPDADFPFGRIKDKVGSNTGTPINEAVYGDFHQFFEKLMNEAGLTANELPESEYAGFQLMTALVRMFGKLRRVVYEIGAWNMDTDGIKIVSTDVVFAKVRGFSFLIISDAGTEIYSNGQTVSGGNAELECAAAGSDTSTELTITLARTTGGFFDSSSFDDGTMNRGYVIVEYEVDDY